MTYKLIPELRNIVFSLREHDQHHTANRVEQSIHAIADLNEKLSAANAEIEEKDNLFDITSKSEESLYAQLLDANAEIERLKGVGITPRGEPMPQTVDEWRYLYGLAEKGMLEDKETISKLKQKINKLQQRK